MKADKSNGKIGNVAMTVTNMVVSSTNQRIALDVAVNQSFALLSAVSFMQICYEPSFLFNPYFVTFRFTMLCLRFEESGYTDYFRTGNEVRQRKNMCSVRDVSS